MIKHSLYALGACALVSSAQAATITFDNVLGDNSLGSVNDGSFTVSAAGTGSTGDFFVDNPYEITYNVTGLDIEGDMVADDTLTVTLSLTGSGRINHFGFSGIEGTFGMEGQGNSAFNGTETMTFAFDSASFTYGSGNTAAIAQFNGFTAVSSSDNAVTVTGADNVVASGFDYSFDVTQAFTVQATNTITRIDGASFSVTAVPEPSSTALLGLGGLALIMRRRK